MNNNVCFLHFSWHWSVNWASRFFISSSPTYIHLFLPLVTPTFRKKKKKNQPINIEYRTLIPLTQELGLNALDSPTIKKATWSLISCVLMLTIILHLTRVHCPFYCVKMNMKLSSLFSYLSLYYMISRHVYFKSFLPYPWCKLNKTAMILATKTRNCLSKHLCSSPRPWKIHNKISVRPGPYMFSR